MADTILCIGTSNEKLPKLFEKLGYQIQKLGDGLSISGLSSEEALDLVIYESSKELKFEEFWNLLRSQPATKHSALIYISSDETELEELSGESYEGVEFLSSSYSLGILASRIATQLRLRKTRGLNENSSSLAEVNAALRDLNAHYQKELEEARLIQASLLPSALDYDERYEIAVCYRPLEEVGGDWYNFHIEKSGKISAQVADVSGHGLAAAFLGSMAKLGFSAVTEELPHLLFAKINELLTPQMPPGRFVTMCGLLFDPENGHIDFARAGHQPALVLRNSSREVDELKGDGFAMGFFEEAEYTHEQTNLQRGDMILIFSDGLVEAQDRNSKAFDLRGVAESLVSAPRDATADEVLEKLIKDFEAFLDGRILKDDVTLLLLRRR